MNAAEITLAEIRKTHDTLKLNAEEFSALAEAVVFYLRCHSPSDAAKLAIADVFVGDSTPSEAGF